MKGNDPTGEGGVRTTGLEGIVDPRERLAAAVRNHVRHFGENMHELKVCARELEALEGDSYSDVHERRRAYFEAVHELVKELDPELPTIQADAGQLYQVLINLSVNAIQAMPNGGRLTIRTQRAEEGVELVVHQRELAVGALGVLGDAGRIFSAWRRMNRALETSGADLVVLVDSPDFNIPLARRAKKVPPSAAIASMTARSGAELMAKAMT